MNKIISKKNAQKWANALRSGKYNQTSCSLQDLSGYCCLGVACKIFIPKTKQIKFNNLLFGGLPIDQKYAPKWLKNINDNLSLFTQNHDCFSDLNDSKDYTFDEIADVIELIYIHEVI